MSLKRQCNNNTAEIADFMDNFLETLDSLMATPRIVPRVYAAMVREIDSGLSAITT